MCLMNTLFLPMIIQLLSTITGYSIKYVHVLKLKIIVLVPSIASREYHQQISVVSFTLWTLKNTNLSPFPPQAPEGHKFCWKEEAWAIWRLGKKLPMNDTWGKRKYGIFTHAQFESLSDTTTDHQRRNLVSIKLTWLRWNYLPTTLGWHVKTIT